MWSPLKFNNLKKYFLASLINTIIGILMIMIVYELTSQKYLTIFVCCLIGYFYSIITYHFIAFPGKLIHPPYRKYSLTYSSSFLLNGLLTRLGNLITEQFLLIQLFVIPIVVIIQWLASNLWVFNSKE